MKNIVDITKEVDCHMWVMEQTKEARFLPSLVQDKVQIGVIFNGNNIYVDELLKGDILMKIIMISLLRIDVIKMIFLLIEKVLLCLGFLLI